MSSNPSTERGLDHMVLAVSDLDVAVARYRELGFTTTPKAMHPWGTGNALVQLDRSFFELLSVEQPAGIQLPATGEFSFGHYNQRFLAEHSDGMSMLVFSSTDAAADRARWRAASLDVYAPFDFERTARLPDGSEVTVAFSLSFVTHPEMPWAAWFVCQQHAPEHFWKPQYQMHANGARALERVILSANDPARYAAFLGALFDSEGKVEMLVGGVALRLPYGRVELLSPERVGEVVPGAEPTPSSPRFLAATVSVDDLGALDATLAASEIARVASDDGLWVNASDACGLHLQFR